MIPTPPLSAERVDYLPALPDLTPNGRYRFKLNVARLADGADVFLPVNVIAGISPGPLLLMVAGVHGDEYEGVTAQIELWRELSPEQVQGTVVMVPVANPPAFRAAQRRNPEDCLDMNRVFPGSAGGAITERLAYRLYHDVALKADFVLSMHGWTNGALVVPYVEYPRESAVTEASLAAARAFGLPYVEAFDWPHGLLVAVCTRAGIPAIEPEIGGLASSIPERRARYKQGAYNLMRHLEMIEGKPQVIENSRSVTREMIFSPVGGVLIQDHALQDEVRQGDPVATIYDLHGEPLATCVTHSDGFVAAQQLMATVNPGDLIAVIFMPTEE